MSQNFQTSTPDISLKSKKKPGILNEYRVFSFWRRRRDLNPRYPFGVYTISNRARSASYATSPCCDRYCSQLEYITLFDSICQYLFSVFSQFIFIPGLSMICGLFVTNCGTEKLLTEYQKMDIITEPK